MKDIASKLAEQIFPDARKYSDNIEGIEEYSTTFLEEQHQEFLESLNVLEYGEFLENFYLEIDYLCEQNNIFD
jgi:hypothetical protein